MASDKVQVDQPCWKIEVTELFDSRTRERVLLSFYDRSVLLGIEIGMMDFGTVIQV